MPRKNKSLIDQAIDTTSDAVDAALPVIESAVQTVRDQVRDLSKDAAVGAKGLAQDTKSKAGPLLADSKLLAAEIAEATREVAIPKAKTAAVAAAASAADLAASGKQLAEAKVAEVKGEPQKKKHRVRKVLVFGSLAALAGFVVTKLRAKPTTDNWQSSYTPPTPPAPEPTGGAHLADEAPDDEAGADPTEALSDATEEPHAVTTPDDPAEVIDIADDDGHTKQR